MASDGTLRVSAIKQHPHPRLPKESETIELSSAQAPVTNIPKHTLGVADEQMVQSFRTQKVLQMTPLALRPDTLKAVKLWTHPIPEAPDADVTVSQFLLSHALFSDLRQPFRDEDAFPQLSHSAIGGAQAAEAYMTELAQCYNLIGDKVHEIAMKLFPEIVRQDDQAVLWDIKYRNTLPAARAAGSTGIENLFNKLHVDDFPQSSRHGQKLINTLGAAVEGMRRQGWASNATPRDGIRKIIESKQKVKMSFNVWMLLSDDDRASPLVFADPDDCDMVDADYDTGDGQLAKLRGTPLNMYKSGDMNKGDFFVFLSWSLSHSKSPPHAGARHAETVRAPPRESVDLRFAIVAP